MKRVVAGETGLSASAMDGGNNLPQVQLQTEGGGRQQNSTTGGTTGSVIEDGFGRHSTSS